MLDVSCGVEGTTFGGEQSAAGRVVHRLGRISLCYDDKKDGISRSYAPPPGGRGGETGQIGAGEREGGTNLAPHD